MKEGTKVVITNAYDGFEYKNGDKAFYNRKCSFSFENGMQCNLFPSEYEEVRDPHIFDQIMEEMTVYRKRIDNATSIEIFCDFSGRIVNEDDKMLCCFGSLEGALNWLKEQNKPKEEIIKLNGGFTISQLKQMIAEREKK